MPVFENTKATCGNSADRLFDPELHGLRLGKRGARNAHGVHGDILLVERRDEFLAEPCKEQPRQTNKTTAPPMNRERGTNRPAQRGCVKRLQPAHETVLLFLNAAGDHDGDHRRHEGQRQHEGRGKRDDDGQRHRLEHLAFDAAEGQQRHVDQDDDRLAVDGGLDHLRRGFDDRRQPLVLGEPSARARAGARPDVAGCFR